MLLLKKNEEICLELLIAASKSQSTCILTLKTFLLFLRIVKLDETTMGTIWKHLLSDTSYYQNHEKCSLLAWQRTNYYSAFTVLPWKRISLKGSLLVFTVYSTKMLPVLCAKRCRRTPRKRPKQRVNCRCWNHEVDWKQFIRVSDNGL